ncbi:EAL domain-containing protein [Enterobacter vonholyi]
MIIPSALTLPHAVQPFDVQSFGRRWLLTPMLEPLWTPDGELYALELLSRLHGRETGDSYPAGDFFADLPQTELARILSWQLELLALLRPWCETRRVPVSINLLRPQALVLVSHTAMAEAVLALAPWLRLEISENFIPPGGGGGTDPVLDALRPLAPLWLDDFGAGSTGLAWLMNGQFMAVKLDRRLFSELAGLPEGVAFMAALSALAQGLDVKLIAEGVADDTLMQSARDAGVDACQGWRWTAVSVSELGDLPARLPDLPVRRAP